MAYKILNKYLINDITNIIIDYNLDEKDIYINKKINIILQIKNIRFGRKKVIREIRSSKINGYFHTFSKDFDVLSPYFYFFKDNIYHGKYTWENKDGSQTTKIGKFIKQITEGHATYKYCGILEKIRENLLLYTDIYNDGYQREKNRTSNGGCEPICGISKCNDVRR